MSTLEVSLITFNCGKALLDPNSFAQSMLSQRNSPELLVISLQEVAPLAYSLLGGSFLYPFLRRVWTAVRIASADHEQYEFVVAQHVGTTAIMLFVKPHARRQIQNIEVACTSVGDYGLSNKGAVGLQLNYIAEGNKVRRLCFVAAHLAPMEDGTDRRNEDWKVIARTLVFEPLKSAHNLGISEDDLMPLMADLEESVQRSGPSGIYTAGTLLFVAGDLNYRTSNLKPKTGDDTTFPQPYSDLELWKDRDQLNKERDAGHTLQALSEPPINFPPTYKYALHPDRMHWPTDGSEPETWLWAKHRFPSWCDRILFSSTFMANKAITVLRYTALPLLSSSDHRPVVLDVSVELDSSSWIMAADSQAPFRIDPTWKSRRMSTKRIDFVVGLFAYLISTWEGNGILIASAVGAFGGYAVFSSLLTE